MLPLLMRLVLANCAQIWLIILKGKIFARLSAIRLSSGVMARAGGGGRREAGAKATKKRETRTDG